MRTIKLASQAALLVAACLGASVAKATPCCNVTKTVESVSPSFPACFCSNISYGTDPAQKLDIYKPTGTVPAGGHPTIVWVHGGGFVGTGRAFDLESDGVVTSEEDWAAVLRQVSRGFAVVAIDYRTASSTVHFTDMRHDVQQAIRWVRWQAGTYGLATGRIGAWGHSAGATLVTLAAGYRAQNPSETWSFGTGYTALANYSDTASILIAYSGIYDFTTNLVTVAKPGDPPIAVSSFLFHKSRLVRPARTWPTPAST